MAPDLTRLTYYPASIPTKNYLLTHHPGGFLVGTTKIVAYADSYGASQGFHTIDMNYPLGSITEAMNYCSSIAQYVSGFGNVFAYGESAGGTLAAWLGVNGYAWASAVYCCVPNVWPWANQNPTVMNYLHPTQTEADAVSPALHSAKRQVYARAGHDDQQVSYSSVVTWGATDPKVTVDVVPGDHLGSDPTQKNGNTRAAIGWLVQKRKALGFG